MLNDRFSASERTGNRRNAALRYREKSVDNSLPRNHGHIGRLFFLIRSCLSDGPAGEHADFRFAHLRNRFGYIEFAFFNVGYISAHAERNHYFMRNDGRFLNGTQNVARGNFVADLLFGNEFPFFFAIEVVYLQTSRNTVAVMLDDFFERALNTVENSFDKPRRKLDGKGITR